MLNTGERVSEPEAKQREKQKRGASLEDVDIGLDLDDELRDLGTDLPGSSTGCPTGSARNG